jgi:hypothetical protein
MTTSGSVNHPNIALGLARLTSSFYLHVLAPTPIISYWLYYSFNPYKPYVCEYVWECEYVWVCEYVCVCVSVWVCVQIISKNLKKFQKSKKKTQKFQKSLKNIKNPKKFKKSQKS